eukprot:6633582-Pyramimonas_sp.AAC.1
MALLGAFKSWPGLQSRSGSIGAFQSACALSTRGLQPDRCRVDLRLSMRESRGGAAISGVSGAM